jgi:hypothetical protein
MAANGERRARRLSPHSRPSRIAVLDRRSCEFKRLQVIRDGLLEHLGGHASPVQLALVERAATLTLHIETIDRKAFANGGLDEKSSRVYLGYTNSLSRLLRTLGIKAAAAPPVSLAEYFASADGDDAVGEAAD